MAAEPAAVMGDVSPLSPFDRVTRAVRWIMNLCLLVAAILFCAALAGLAIDVFMRYAFDSSVRGMQEIVTLLFTWIFMIGIAALYARKGDASITFVINALPTRAQIVFALLVSLILASGMLIVFVETMRLIVAQAGITSAELGIPEPFRFAPLALAAAVICITSLIDAWGCLIWARSGVRPVIPRDAEH